jgi:peroxiredoxin Q/BCP
MTAYRDKYATLFNDGKGVVLLAISVDPVPDLVSWASDKQFPFRLLSDSGGVVGKVYGAYKAEWKMNSRTLFVIDPEGKITYVAAPFQEIDPAAYVTLGQEIGKVGKKG